MNPLQRYPPPQLFVHADRPPVAVMHRIFQQSAVRSEQAEIHAPAVDADSRQLVTGATLHGLPHFPVNRENVPVHDSGNFHGFNDETADLLQFQSALLEAAEHRTPAFSSQVETEKMAGHQRHLTTITQKKPFPIRTTIDSERFVRYAQPVSTTGATTLVETTLPRIPDAEFAGRIDRLKSRMRAEHIDLLVLYSTTLDPGHVRYLSDVVGINEAAAMVIPLDADPIVCVGPACQAWGPHKSRVKDVRILLEVGEVAAPEYTVGEKRVCSELFRELGAASGPVRKIGVVGKLTFPQIIYAQLQKTFPSAEIVDAEPMLFELRVRKSANEIACMRKAAEILDASYTNAVARIRPGWTELDIMAEIVAGILKGGAEDTGASWTPMIPSGPKHSNLCMNRNSLRKVQEGEMICLQSAATYEGYNAALATPFVLGTVPPEIKQAVNAAHRAMEAMIAVLKPGATSKSVNSAGRDILRQTGYAQYSPYAMVHNIGCLECESPWMPDDQDYLIVEGMVVCIDVFLFRMPWGSFRIENTLAITANGTDLLTRFNRQFVPVHFA